MIQPFQRPGVAPVDAGPKVTIPLTKPATPSSATLVRTAKQRLKDAELEPPTLRMFGNYVCSNRITLCFADTKVGKTILAMQLSDCISKGLGCLEMENEAPAQKVLYYDFELMDKDFEDRYKNHEFSDNFLIATLDTSVDVEFSIAQIEADVEKYEAGFVVIDNIMALTANSLSEADAALKLMKQLDRLKKRLKISILVLAHNNKITPGQPINRNQLAGSKVLQNYIDSLIAIGESTQAGKRYIKHLFTRTGRRIEEVLVCDIIDFDGCLFFASTGFDEEENHVGEVASKQQEEPQSLSYWQEIFNNDTELHATELKNRLMALGLNEKQAMHKMYRAAELDKPRRAYFSIRQTIPDTKFPNSQIPEKPYAFGKSGNLGISDNPFESFENQKPANHFDLAAIAYALFDGYEMRDKISAVRALTRQCEVTEPVAYQMFADMVKDGHVCYRGDGDYCLKD